MLAWITPVDQPGTPVAGLVWLPNGDEYAALVMGAYAELLFDYNFEQIGGLTPEDAAAAFQEPGYHTARHWANVWNRYTQKMLALYDQGMIAYWPLWEALAATRARDFSGAAFHGTPTGGTWESGGIGDGMTALALSGSGSKVDVYSTGLRDALNGDEGHVSLWANVTNWLSGSPALIALRSTTAYYILIQANSGYLNFTHKSPGQTAKTISYELPGDTAGYHQVQFSWSLAGNRIAAFFDGVLVGEDTHGGTWGTSKIAQAVLGAFNATPLNPLPGSLAHVGLWDRVMSAEEIAGLAYN